MMPGVPERRSHDYVRHGTTDLFAASSIADGTVIHSLWRHHRAAEFKKFLARIDKAVPAGLEVHLICDNLATRKTPVIQAWLARHPRFCLHFTPTGSSWINQVVRHEVACDEWYSSKEDRPDAGDVVPGPVRKDRPRPGVRCG